VLSSYKLISRNKNEEPTQFENSWLAKLKHFPKRACTMEVLTHGS
jgi:hypothetical protein